MTRKYRDTDFITGLRAIAIMMVFLIHSGGGGLRDINDYFDSFVNSGKYGVQIFFVISGFTIFYQFFSANYNFNKFIKVRLLRISLAYYPILFLFFLGINFGLIVPNYFAQTFSEGNVSIVNLFMHVTYLGFFDKEYINTILGIEWSLYVEVFFYFIIGLIISKGLWKKGTYNIAILLLFVFVNIILLSLLKFNYLDSHLFDWMPFRHGVLFLMGGCAYIYRYNSEYRNKTLSDFSLLLFFSQFLITPLINSVLINEMMFAITTMLVIAFGMKDSILMMVINSRVFQLIGSFSFSIYLLHLVIIQYTNHSFVLSIFITLFISYFYSLIFEVKLYKKFKKRIS